MLSDVRDVLFQGEPFKGMTDAPQRFFLKYHTVTIGTQPGNANWVRNAYGESALARIAAYRVSCSGVTFGTTAGMLAFLRAVTGELTRVTPQIAGLDGYDQGVHNYLIWTGAFPAAELLENSRGPVLTMHGAPLEEFRRDDRGRLLDERGEIIPVLHQYDRHPALQKGLCAQFAPTEPAR